MRWIGASPAFDLFFIWSGAPIGLALATLFWTRQFQLLVPILTLFIALDSAHLLSSPLLVAAYPPMRRRALAEPIKFIIVPALIVALTALFWGYLRSLPTFYLGGYRINPAGYTFVAYALANAAHFGNQNFGVVQIYRHKMEARSHRTLDRLVCLAGPAVFMLAPITLYLSILGIPYPQWFKSIALAPAMLPPLLFFAMSGIINVNHWLTAVGLASKTLQTVMPWWAVMGLLGLLGASGYAWHGPGLGSAVYKGIPALINVNFALGFGHFWWEGKGKLLGVPLGAGLYGRDSPVMRAVLS